MLPEIPVEAIPRLREGQGVLMGPDVCDAAGGRPDGSQIPLRLLHQGLHLAAVRSLGEIEGDGVRLGGQQEPQAQIDSHPQHGAEEEVPSEGQGQNQKDRDPPAQRQYQLPQLSLLHLSCTPSHCGRPRSDPPVRRRPGRGSVPPVLPAGWDRRSRT